MDSAPISVKLTVARADEAAKRLKLTALVFADLANTAQDEGAAEDETIAREMGEWACALALRIAQAAERNRQP